jgi:hypothetical protein
MPGTSPGMTNFDGIFFAAIPVAVNRSFTIPL